MINQTNKRFVDIIFDNNIYVITGKSQEKLLKNIVSDRVLPKNILFERTKSWICVKAFFDSERPEYVFSLLK